MKLLMTSGSLISEHDGQPIPSIEIGFEEFPDESNHPAS
jgi:hypothetical protein